MNTKQQLQEEVRILLKSLEKVDYTKVSNNDNSLNLKKVSKLKEVKDVVNELKRLGINRDYLFKNFLYAGIVLGNLLEYKK